MNPLFFGLQTCISHTFISEEGSIYPLFAEKCGEEDDGHLFFSKWPRRAGSPIITLRHLPHVQLNFLSGRGF